mgnify:CR=1 FL=1
MMAAKLPRRTHQQPTYQNQQPQQMGFGTQSQRQQWQGANAVPALCSPAIRRVILMTSLSLTIPMTCRSKEVW